jgi:hypothetical protein
MTVYELISRLNNLAANGCGHSKIVRYNSGHNDIGEEIEPYSDCEEIVILLSVSRLCDEERQELIRMEVFGEEQ